ncbi:MAG TPA: Uma2 family endonuclease [Gemmataceae bacterium]|jgi:Uma2 family endonuclease
MIAAATEKHSTPQDLLTMPDGDFYELVDGRLVERKMSIWSSYVAGVIFHLLNSFCRERHLGWVLPEGTSFQCFPAHPSKVRRPDTVFIRLQRLSLEQATTEGHCPVAPDLAVEVISPNDTAYEIDEKVREFLDAGVLLVWVVNPEQRTVKIHRASGTGTILQENDEISGEDVIPGFRCRVGDFTLPPPGVVPGH